MESLRDRLASFFSAIVEEAETNSDFALKLERALEAFDAGARQHGAGEDGASTPEGVRKGARRARAMFDPFEVFEQGEQRLRQALGELNIEQLKDVVAEYGMDRSRLALKWKTRERLIHLVVEIVSTRARKGDAFKAAPEGEAPWRSHEDPPVDKWIELAKQARAQHTTIELDSPMEMEFGFDARSRRVTTVPAQLDGPIRVSRVEERTLELGFPLRGRGGITMVTVPFSMLQDVWMGSEGSLHVLLRQSIVFANGTSRFVRT